jgi:hypothetical protein
LPAVTAAAATAVAADSAFSADISACVAAAADLHPASAARTEVLFAPSAAAVLSATAAAANDAAAGRHCCCGPELRRVLAYRLLTSTRVSLLPPPLTETVARARAVDLIPAPAASATRNNSSCSSSSSSGDVGGSEAGSAGVARLAAAALAPVWVAAAEAVSRPALCPPLSVARSPLVPAACRRAWFRYLRRVAAAAVPEAAADAGARQYGARKRRWLRARADEWINPQAPPGAGAGADVDSEAGEDNDEEDDESQWCGAEGNDDEDSDDACVLPYAWRHTPLLSSPFIHAAPLNLSSDAAAALRSGGFAPTPVLLPPQSCPLVALRPADAFFAGYLPFIADELEASVAAWELAAALTAPAPAAAAAPASAPAPVSCPSGYVHTRVVGMAVADAHRPLAAAHLLRRAATAAGAEAAAAGAAPPRPRALLRRVSWGAWLRALEGDAALGVPAAVALHRHRTLTAYRLRHRLQQQQQQQQQQRPSMPAPVPAALLPSAPWLYLPLLQSALRLDRACEFVSAHALTAARARAEAARTNVAAPLVFARVPAAAAALAAQAAAPAAAAAAAEGRAHRLRPTDGGSTRVVHFASRAHGRFVVSLPQEAAAAVNAAAAALTAHAALTAPAVPRPHFCIPLVALSAPPTPLSNERLEFIGDSFLKALTATALTHAPELFALSEGRLSAFKDSFVSNVNLARASRTPLHWGRPPPCPAVPAHAPASAPTAVSLQDFAVAAQAHAALTAAAVEPLCGPLQAAGVSVRLRARRAGAAPAGQGFSRAVTVAGAVRFARFDAVSLHVCVRGLEAQTAGAAQRRAERASAAGTAARAATHRSLAVVEAVRAGAVARPGAGALPAPWVRALCGPATPLGLFPPSLADADAGAGAAPVLGPATAAARARRELSLAALLASQRATAWLPGGALALSPMAVAAYAPEAAVTNFASRRRAAGVAAAATAAAAAVPAGSARGVGRGTGGDGTCSGAAAAAATGPRGG